MTSTEHTSPTLSPGTARPTGRRAAYRLARIPPAAWNLAGGPRRTWVSRAVLLTILAFQAALSLRVSNTAFQDEALYLAAGHAELSHLLHGAPKPVNYAAYFSGAPQLYPLLAAAVDQGFGLAGARMLSLLCMLGTTALLYSFTRRLFNERVGLTAAALFSVVQSTIVMGNIATYDAPALCLLATATWIVVRTARMCAPAVLLAAPVATLAVAVKYAAGLYVPTIVALSLLTALPHHRARAFLRPLLLASSIGAVLVLGMYGTGLVAGVRHSTTHRSHGSDSPLFLLQQSLSWGGILFVAAVGGAFAYARRSRMNESPLAAGLGGPSRAQRLLLGLLLCTTVLLAPAYQMYLGTVVSLFKHIGFGLLFAAPLAGVGVIRLVGAHFRHPHVGIVLWTVTLCLGLSQAQWRFATWPDSSALIRTISSQVDGKGRYLSSTPEVPAYYLRSRTTHRQWQGVFGMEYTDRARNRHTGDDAYRAALRDGEFDLVVLDGMTNVRVNDVIANELDTNPKYQPLANLPFRITSNDIRHHLLADASAGQRSGRYQIWKKR
ncbi:ArnT family glycosyltransferase [Streptomyces sp. NPDC085639]|uniref:ArnT family glycosyltransferase n=1 Tax=Streptomyces sp. NPDC085639 TaxID=3365734 RepID=UPI0037CFC16C